MTDLLSKATVDAIAAVSDTPASVEDVDAAFRSVGIEPRHDQGSVRTSATAVAAWLPSTAEGARLTINALDLSNPDIVAKILRYTARVAELYAAGRESHPDRVVRLRNCLRDDGYDLDAPGDPLAAISTLAQRASVALSDAAAIRQELTRMERALPDDTGALIGRAKNLIEATCKAVLQLRGQHINDADDVPALVYQVSTVLGVHGTQASGSHPEQVRRILGRLHAISQDVAELRNRVGDGHGMSGLPVVDAAAGRLAARSAIAWCAFVLEVAQGTGRSAAPTP